MEASTIPARAALSPAKGASARRISGPLLRLRTDEQLVRLFRTGSEEAFGVLHDRYRARLLAYARQMLGASRADAEDVLQDVFVRAYAALRADGREVSLRAWLYRIAHNRCIDELRRPASGHDAGAEALELLSAPGADPAAAVERRESLRRLVADVQRLPEQQRSALLMREISGMAYSDLASALDVTVPAIKSLLVRARIGLAQAAEARDTACAAIRADLADAHERGVRASGLAKRHLSDCAACRAYKRELRALDARLAALVPAVGPLALIAKLLGGGAGVSAGAAGGGGAAAGAGAVAAGAGAGAVGAGAAGLSVSHVAAVVAVAVVGAGGAVEVQRTLSPDTKPTPIERVVATPPQASHAPPLAPALLADGVDARDVLVADLRREAALVARREQAAQVLRLRLRAAPAPAVQPQEPAAAPVDGVTTAPAGSGNGGAAAPAEPALEPVAPPASAPAGPPGSTEPTGAGGQTSPASPTAPPAASGSAEAAPSTAPASATPSPSPAPSASTAAPPTSTTVGGAAYVAPRR